jgi:hypothetical protein
MLAKIFKHGRGAGSAALGYLLHNRNHAGELRAIPPKVLRGDPEITAALINSLSFSQKYTSGVLSFSQSESTRLTLEKMASLIDSFEHDFLAPGMDLARLSTVWVQHQDHGRHELHFVIANVDLITSKRFPAYYDRADRPRLAAWQDLKNLEYGMDNPRESERRRAVDREWHLPQNKAEYAQAINDAVAERYVQGAMKDRTEVVAFINSLEGLHVGRQGKDYITVHFGDGKQERFRLKGELFSENRGVTCSIAEQEQRSNAAGRSSRGESLTEVRKRFERTAEFRRTYIEKRFGNRADYHPGQTRGVERGAHTPGRHNAEESAPTVHVAEVVNASSNRSDVGSMRLSHSDDMGVAASRAMECADKAYDHERRQELSRNRRRAVVELQSQQKPQSASLATMQDDGNQFAIGAKDERTGYPLSRLATAVIGRISAAREAVASLVRTTIEQVEAGARRTLAALGQVDRELSRHDGLLATGRDTVTSIGQKTREMTRQRYCSRGRWRS